MPLAPARIRNQPRKLRKSLKKLPQDLSAERVHQVRTRMRRLEALVHALAVDGRQNERRLLQAIRPVRKRAGKVRDMDVLADFASAVKTDNERGCSLQLLEYLGIQRERQARRLQKVAAAHASELKRRLKRCEGLLDEILEGRNDASNNKKAAAETAALALQLEAELRDWPPLNRENLHPFRLKVKELRYVLEMGTKAGKKFVSELGEVKDAVGEWHDWEELVGIAAEVIQHKGCGLLVRIRSTSEQKFEHALAMASRLRRTRLGAQTKRRKDKSPLKSFPRVAQGAIESVAALAP
jgi:CHAD domain-containing protein